MLTCEEAAKIMKSDPLDCSRADVVGVIEHMTFCRTCATKRGLDKVDNAIDALTPDDRVELCRIIANNDGPLARHAISAVQDPELAETNRVLREAARARRQQRPSQN